jgi:ribonuclease Z
MKKLKFPIIVVLCIGVGLGLMIARYGSQMATAAESESKVSPVKASARDFYAPNSEDLGPNEMRLVACGTGMPTARPKQAASCWLLELGNGDKFVFDIGTGSAERISAMQIPYNYLDKVFLSHLHTDHFGDLDALFVGGALAGRQKPLRVWGPKGDTPERGTKYALDHLYKALTWDLDGRAGITDPRGYQPFEVTEFDYKGVNKIIYQENGVTVRSIPAIHSLDGPVSFSVHPGDPLSGWSGQFYPRVERSQVCVRRRHLSKQVVRGVYQGCRPGNSRMLHYRAGYDRQVSIHAAKCFIGRDPDPHRT